MKCAQKITLGRPRRTGKTRPAGPFTRGQSDKGRLARHFTAVILVAFLPSMAVGVLAYKIIKNVLFSPLVVSVMLIVGGIAMLLIERLRPPPRFHAAEEITLRRALAVGLFQCVAMIPGVSRAAATIMGGMLMGIDRRTATEFSFFLAIPTMVAATTYDLYKNWHALNADGILLIAVGFLGAFLTALVLVRTAIGFVAPEPGWRRGHHPDVSPQIQKRRLPHCVTAPRLSVR